MAVEGRRRPVQRTERRAVDDEIICVGVRERLVAPAPRRLEGRSSGAGSPGIGSLKVHDLPRQRVEKVVRAVLRLDGERAVRGHLADRSRRRVRRQDEVGQRRARRAEVRRRHETVGIGRSQRGDVLRRDVDVYLAVRSRRGKRAVDDERAGRRRKGQRGAIFERDRACLPRAVPAQRATGPHDDGDGRAPVAAADRERGVVRDDDAVEPRNRHVVHGDRTFPCPADRRVADEQRTRARYG